MRTSSLCYSHDDVMVYINKSGFKHKPYVLTYVDAYEIVDAELAELSELEERVGRLMEEGFILNLKDVATVLG